MQKYNETRFTFIKCYKNTKLSKLIKNLNDEKVLLEQKLGTNLLKPIKERMNQLAQMEKFLENYDTEMKQCQKNVALRKKNFLQDRSIFHLKKKIFFFSVFKKFIRIARFCHGFF